VALLLKEKEITRVRPLTGGIDAWLANKFPMEALDIVKQSAEGKRGERLTTTI
jgi:hypothetical protein